MQLRCTACVAGCSEKPSAHDKLLALAEWLRVLPEELRDGKEMKSAYSNNVSWDEGVGYQEREVFEAFLKLPVWRSARWCAR